MPRNMRKRLVGWRAACLGHIGNRVPEEMNRTTADCTAEVQVRAALIDYAFPIRALPWNLLCLLSSKRLTTHCSDCILMKLRRYELYRDQSSVMNSVVKLKFGHGVAVCCLGAALSVVMHSTAHIVLVLLPYAKIPSLECFMLKHMVPCPPAPQAYAWLCLAHNSETRYDQLAARQTALQVRQSIGHCCLSGFAP